MNATQPSRVICSGDGLELGYIRHPIEATIDTRQAGPGELTVFCDGPENKAFCELRDHRDGVFTLTIRAQDVGPHALHIKYDGQDVPGSPFDLRVSIAGLIRVAGPGIQHGLLGRKHASEIQIDTEKAGQGEVFFKVGGPKGAFRTELRKEGKVLKCRYNPREPGLYTVYIGWSGDPVPGSPFKVFMGRTGRELQEYIASQPAAPGTPPTGPPH